MISRNTDPLSDIVSLEKKAAAQDGVMKSTSKSKYTLEQKFNMIVEASLLSEAELSAYCRKKGIYPDDIHQWKSDFLLSSSKPAKAPNNKKERKLLLENKKLKNELNRKEKALAETAALLVLRKKLDAFYGVGEED